MKKEVFLILVLFFLVSAGVVAQTTDINTEVEEFVKNFVEDANIVEGQEIQEVVKINQSDLPDDVQIKDIEESNLGIFEVNYTEGNTTKNVFVVTYATNEFRKKEFTVTKNIHNLYFAFEGETNTDSYLEVAGISLGENKGYVMLRSGSITGISTSLDLSGSGKIFISVYKNGLNTGFHNSLTTDGEKIDYDLQSENIVTYSPGDVISVRVEGSGNINWGNVITTVETTS